MQFMQYMQYIPNWRKDGYKPLDTTIGLYDYSAHHEAKA